ncbi:MAG TPA: HAMP domain-containing histidine kinase [Calditrichaeota bacterium]|nr:HAMP domain-containing histidine kinase [Calditrichota bacterium]
MSKTMSVFNRKGNLKGFLFLFGIVLIISGILYTQQLVNILKEKSTEYLRFKIKIFEQSINNPSADTDFSFLFNNVIQEADYPIIYTDNQGNPQNWRNISPSIDSKTAPELSPDDSLYLMEIYHQISSENKPIPIKSGDFILGYYYYGYSPVIYELRMLPFIAILSGAIFILFGYIGFSYIKRSEQRYIWVGMAKETAHQLGTPLSSLSGWLELLSINPDILEKAVKEMENDIDRLKKVANRFSKIGSVPELKKTELSTVINHVVDYFNRRLPNMQKQISIKTDLKKGLFAKINPDLFEWVLENLIKNAIDAIGDKKGKIEIIGRYTNDKKGVHIDILDDGKGITSKQKKNIFRPGYSSKKRGWGLGLSLARRIIEEYHNGRLFLKESRPFQKTVFRIFLKNV